MPTLNWHKREEAVRAATRAPYRLLEPVAELSHGDADSENRLIKGDEGEHLVQHEQQKKNIGERWEEKSGGKALRVWAVKKDEHGRDVHRQLQDKLARSWAAFATPATDLFEQHALGARTRHRARNARGFDVAHRPGSRRRLPGQRLGKTTREPGACEVPSIASLLFLYCSSIVPLVFPLWAPRTHAKTVWRFRN